MLNRIRSTGRFICKKGWVEAGIITGLALVPLFVNFPFRVNIFLSWEGAYRLYEGEMPYRDFGIPMGYMYWVVPALFFKIFGPSLVSLVKAQVLINIISGFAFRSVLKSFSVQTGLRIIAVFVFCISYSFFNFWPWYNHTVIVYELVSLAFLFRYIFSDSKFKGANLVLSALFTAVTFMTKQDVGGMTVLFCLFLIALSGYYHKKIIPTLIYAGAFGGFLFLMILPFLRYSFGYWFNHGQPPHTARFSAGDIVNDFFNYSQWIKFYILFILLFMVMAKDSWKTFFKNERMTLFLVLTGGILGEAVVIQVTSYTPPDNNIFFHSFAIVYLLFMLSQKAGFSFNTPRIFIVGLLGAGLWWSGVFWKYVNRITDKFKTEQPFAARSPENLVNRETYMISRDTSIKESDWVYSGLKTFQHIYMPKPTVEGIKRVLALPVVKEKGTSIRVLNMSELTPLAEEMHYKLEKSPEYPLWYHLGVAMFNKQAEMFENKIRHNEYDLVLFEMIPGLNNFYPFRVRDTLLHHYQKIDSFYAPRRGMETAGMIEVFVKQSPK